jgi:Zn finger protein HypA/HybF involved in hydrogenase expression
MIESETLLEKCPQCGAWPMAANIQRSAFALREIQFRCPRCQAEEAGRLRRPTPPLRAA